MKKTIFIHRILTGLLLIFFGLGPTPTSSRKPNPADLSIYLMNFWLDSNFIR